MLDRTRARLCLFVIMAMFPTAACALAAGIFATPPPAATATLRPTLRSTPTVDLSGVVLHAADLPAGFEEVSADEAGIGASSLATELYVPQDVFLFVDRDSLQIVYGFNFIFRNETQRRMFDMAVDQDEAALLRLVHDMGFGGQGDESLLPGLDEIGEARLGASMASTMDGAPTQMEIVLFRRGLLGAAITLNVPEGKKATFTIQELALKLDERLRRAVEPAPTAAVP